MAFGSHSGIHDGTNSSEAIPVETYSMYAALQADIYAPQEDDLQSHFFSIKQDRLPLGNIHLHIVRQDLSSMTTDTTWTKGKNIPSGVKADQRQMRVSITWILRIEMCKNRCAPPKSLHNQASCQLSSADWQDVHPNFSSHQDQDQRPACQHRC